MSGVAAPESGSSRRPRTIRHQLGAWLLPPDFYREREFRADNWVEAVFEPAALVVLIGLFVGGVVTFGLALAPGWDARFVLPLSLIVALEGFFYARRFARPAVLWKEWGALLALPVLALKLLPYAIGAESLAVDAAEWWRSPGSFFSGAFVVGLSMLLLAWLMALDSTMDLNRLRIQPGEIPADAKRYELYNDGWRFVDHATPLRYLGYRVLWGGVLLVFLGGLSALGTQQLLTPAALLQLVAFVRPTISYSYSNVILYFVVGLLLLSEAQYVRQRTAWKLEQLEPPRELAPRWIAEAAVATLAVVLLALALPTDYAMGLADVLELAMSVVVYLVQIVVGLVMLIILVLSWPLRWLLPSGGDASPQAQPTPPPPVTPAEPVAWLQLLQSLVFWIVALAIVAYLLSVVWRRRPPAPDWLKASMLGSLLVAVGRLLAALLRIGRSAASAVAAALPRLRPVQPQPVHRVLRWVSFSRLGPRQLIEYFYLSVLERAARLGVAREKGETASEFSHRLPARLPDVEPDLTELTESFVEARYGPRPVDEGLVRTARAHWQAIKLKLRRRRLRGPARSGTPPAED